MKLLKIILINALVFSTCLYSKNANNNISKKKSNTKKITTKKKKAKAYIPYIVYITKNGKLYHDSEDCPNLDNAKYIYQIDINEVGNKYECDICFDSDYEEAMELVDKGYADDYYDAIEKMDNQNYHEARELIDEGNADDFDDAIEKMDNQNYQEAMDLIDKGQAYDFDDAIEKIENDNYD